MSDNQLSPEVINLMESFIRDMTKHKCAVFGFVFRTDPSPAVGMMRNTKDDPVRMMKVLSDFTTEAVEEGRILDVPVLPLQ